MYSVRRADAPDTGSVQRVTSRRPDDVHDVRGVAVVRAHLHVDVESYRGAARDAVLLRQHQRHGVARVSSLAQGVHHRAAARAQCAAARDALAHGERHQEEPRC